MKKMAIAVASVLTATYIVHPLHILRINAESGATPPAEMVQSARDVLEFVDDSLGLVTGDPVASWVVALYMLQWALESDEQLSFSPASAVTTVSGTYYNESGEQKLLVLTSYEYMASPASHETKIDCGISGDFALIYHVPYGTALQSSFGTDPDGVRWLQVCQGGYVTGNDVDGGFVYDTSGYMSGTVGASYALRSRPYGVDTTVTLPRGSVSTYFIDFNSVYNTSPLMQISTAPAALPEWGNMGGSLTTEKLSDYWYNDFTPYVKTNYPDSTWLVEPDTPPESQYPSEYVTGIPRDWTVVNPPIPTSPTVDFIPNQMDFSQPLEQIRAVRESASAVGFWWWLTDKTLNSLGLFKYFIAFIAFGIAAYCLWRWGS